MLTRSEIAHTLHQAETRGPDADQTWEGWSRFAVDWQVAGRTYTTHIWALSVEDAETRLRALKSSAVVVGQVFAERTV